MRMVPTLSRLGRPAPPVAGTGPNIDDVGDQCHSCSAFLTQVIE